MQKKRARPGLRGPRKRPAAAVREQDVMDDGGSLDEGDGQEESDDEEEAAPSAAAGTTASWEWGVNNSQPLKQEYTDGSVLELISKFVCVSICDCIVKFKFLTQFDLSLIISIFHAL